MQVGWSQVSPARWERSLSGMEDFLLTIGNAPVALYDGRQQYNIFSRVKVEINVPDVQSALQHAWKQLRHQQPDIATTIEDGKKVYETPDEAALQAWLDSTFIVSPITDAEELCRSAKPIRQATLYYLPNSSELVLRAHHYVIDGMGTILFWHTLLEALVSPGTDIKFGQEHIQLGVSLEAALGYTAPPTPEETKKANTLLMSYIEKLPGIGLVSDIGAAPAAQCQNMEYLFSPETTAALIQACKERQLSVTSAVHAAFIRMLMKHADPSSKTSRYTTANEYNLRPYLPAPYNTAQKAVSVYYAPIPFSIDLPASFSEIAQALNKSYHTTLKANPNVVNLTGHYTRVLANLAQTPEFQASPVAKEALVSSFGIVENHLQRTYGDVVTVKDFKFGFDVVLGMSGFFVYTFRDRVRLVYSFNDGYEEPERVGLYLRNIEKILVEEMLGLSA
ncbi:hypothetical protein BDW59DRAFT_36114 [Aspergillus cavernicola]|uniref:Condensation domain-containing protein n=1 Tax=Aspergillus cavernicola TaxID=176166 RepID=A0ABR4IRL7_9EURO